jgi:hypothetical protein
MAVTIPMLVAASRFADRVENRREVAVVGRMFRRVRMRSRKILRMMISAKRNCPRRRKLQHGRRRNEARLESGDENASRRRKVRKNRKILRRRKRKLRIAMTVR